MTTIISSVRHARGRIFRPVLAEKYPFSGNETGTRWLETYRGIAFPKRLLVSILSTRLRGETCHLVPPGAVGSVIWLSEKGEGSDSEERTGVWVGVLEFGEFGLCLVE